MRRENYQRLMYIGTIVMLIMYASAIALLVLSCTSCAIGARFNDGGGGVYTSVFTSHSTVLVTEDPAVSSHLPVILLEMRPATTIGYLPSLTRECRNHVPCREHPRPRQLLREDYKSVASFPAQKESLYKYSRRNALPGFARMLFATLLGRLCGS